MAFVAATQTTIGSDPEAFDLSVPSTDGSQLTLFARISSGTDSITGITDDQTNTWVQDVAPVTSGGVRLTVWRASDVAANTVSITVNMSSAQTMRIVVLEHSGLAAASPFDQTGNATGSSVTPSVTAAGATTQAVETLMMACTASGFPQFTAGTGYVERQVTPDDNLYVEDREVTSTGTYTADGTYDGSNGWIAVIATYKATGGGGGGGGDFVLVAN